MGRNLATKRRNVASTHDSKVILPLSTNMHSKSDKNAQTPSFIKIKTNGVKISSINLQEENREQDTSLVNFASLIPNKRL